MTHTTDSAICYELMVWRRSALWTLIGFGSLATFFALAQINMDYLNAHAYYDLSTKGELHRFPEPGYLEEYTLDLFGLEDPSVWTKYSGPLATNITDPTTGLTETRCVLCCNHRRTLPTHPAPSPSPGTSTSSATRARPTPVSASSSSTTTTRNTSSGAWTP